MVEFDKVFATEIRTHAHCRGESQAVSPFLILNGKTSKISANRNKTQPTGAKEILQGLKFALCLFFFIIWTDCIVFLGNRFLMATTELLLLLLLLTTLSVDSGRGTGAGRARETSSGTSFPAKGTITRVFFWRCDFFSSERKPGTASSRKRGGCDEAHGRDWSWSEPGLGLKSPGLHWVTRHKLGQASH